ncbi:lipoprotein [Gemmatimonadota bacterium]
MRRFVLAALALTVLAACQPATVELTEEQKAEIAAEVSALQAEWDTVYVAHLYDRARSIWTNSPETGWAASGNARWGADMAGTGDRFRAFWNTIDSAEFTRNETRTFVLAPNVAYVMQRLAVILTDTAGVVYPEGTGAYTYVWTKQDGEWRIQFGHSSQLVSQTQ